MEPQAECRFTQHQLALICEGNNIISQSAPEPRTSESGLWRRSTWRTRNTEASSATRGTSSTSSCHLQNFEPYQVVSPDSSRFTWQKMTWDVCQSANGLDALGSKQDGSKPPSTSICSSLYVILPNWSVNSLNVVCSSPTCKEKSANWSESDLFARTFPVWSMLNAATFMVRCRQEMCPDLHSSCAKKQKNRTSNRESIIKTRTPADVDTRRADGPWHWRITYGQKISNVVPLSSRRAQDGGERGKRETIEGEIEITGIRERCSVREKVSKFTHLNKRTQDSEPILCRCCLSKIGVQITVVVHNVRLQRWEVAEGRLCTHEVETLLHWKHVSDWHILKTKFICSNFFSESLSHHFLCLMTSLAAILKD